MLKNKAFFLILLGSCIFSLALYFNYCSAEQVASERLAKEPLVEHVAVEKNATQDNRWYLGTLYDYGDVVLGSRAGEWTESTTWLGRKFKDNRLNRIYTSFSQLERFREKGYTGNLGCYLNFNDYYIHQELGFGWDVDFIYKFQNIAELSHKLYKNLFWQFGYNYRQYNENNTHLLYPGLVYYFLDNYISLDYGLTHIESRGIGQFGAVKGSFAITKRLRYSIGTTVGQWVYDIYGFSARKEYGYTVFTMFNLDVGHGVNLNAGYSYGEEKPSFIKRSFNLSVSASF